MMGAAQGIEPMKGGASEARLLPRHWDRFFCRDFGPRPLTKHCMKPLHWTLLAIGLASCRATGGGTGSKPLGPGSRVVVPSLAQPKVEEESPANRPEVPSPVAAPAAPHTDASPALKLVATALAQALVRIAAAVPSPPAQPPTPLADPTASQTSEPARATEATPAALELHSDAQPLSQGEAELRSALDQAVAEKRWKDVTKYGERLSALPSLDRARGLHQAARFDEELAVIEAALAETPNLPELLEAAGYARLALAAAGRSDLYGPSRDAFARAGGTATALLGQSRAARALEIHDEALDCARQALVILSLRKAERLALDPAAEVVFAEAGLEVQRKLRATPGVPATLLLNEIEAALRSRIGEIPTDNRAYATLAEVYLDVGRVSEAEATAERGLVFSPGEARLMDLVARSALSLNGSEELLDVFKRLREKAPNQALVYWYPALEYFRSSVAHPSEPMPRFNGSGKKQLDAAEDGFRRVRTLDPRYTKSCLGYEALCRALAGWQWYESGMRSNSTSQLKNARRAFLSMNEVAPGLIAVEPAAVDALCKDRVENGVVGLHKIAERYRELKQLNEAASVYDDLAKQAPLDAQWARRAAESASELGDFLALEAESFAKASQGELADPDRLARLRKSAGVRDAVIGTPKELQRLAATGGARLLAAAQAYTHSWGWYLRAVELAPLDARLATDAARMAINHTRTDLARAEELLLGARRLADEQSQAADLKPAERDQLKVAWALAERTLGELEFPIRNNPTAAIRHFERSLEIQPDSQPYVTEFLLPQAVEASKQLTPIPETHPRQDQD